MLSRVADSFYWMSRYLERAEHSARVLDVYLGLTLDDPTDTAGRALLASVAASPAGTDEDFVEVPIEATGRLDARHRARVAGCVAAARENARQIREQISSEMWEQLNTTYLAVRDAEGSHHDNPQAFLRAAVDGAHLFYGVTEATLSHGEGWHYMQLGRYLERAVTTASLLEDYFGKTSTTDEPERPATREYGGRVGLLRASAAFEAYCRCYTADIRPDRMAEFLLLNAESPRSVRFAADRLEDSLRAVARALGRPANGRPERFAGRLRASLNYGTIDEILEDSVVNYVESIGRQCSQIHTAIYQTYISYPLEAAIAR